MIRKIGTILATVILAAPLGADDKNLPNIDEKTAMEAVMKAATPGEPHKRLEPFVGEFDFVAKFWMDPAKDPVESKGRSSNKWVLGNRYIEEQVQGDFGGVPFEGRGVMGYDNLQKKYLSTWIDNMGTGIMFSEGTVNKDGKVFTFTHEDVDPVLNQKIKCKDVTTILGPDSYKTEFFRLYGDKEYKVMELTFTRKK